MDPDGPVEGIAAYFDSLDGTTIADRMAVRKALSALGEAVEAVLEKAPHDPVTGNPVYRDFLDPVTELPVRPDTRDIYRQLEAGVDEDDIVLHSTIPLRIIGVNADVPGDVLVFFDSQGKSLGEVHQSEWQSTDYVTAPSDGAGVLMYLRDTMDQRYSCSPSGSQKPLLTIPYDSFAGSDRAVIDVDSGTYSSWKETINP